MIIEIATLDDPRLDAYARLTDVQLRSRLEPEKGVFIAESGKVIQRALDAGLQPLSLLMEGKWLKPLDGLVARVGREWPDVPVFTAPREVLEGLTGFELTRGALAAFRRPAPRGVPDVVAGARRVAVLEDITNHTNVGAIFRSAAALGVDAVLVSPACHDPLYRRAARVSMGGVFQVPWARIGEEAPGRPWVETGAPLLHGLGFKLAALALRDDAVPIDDPRLAAEERLALVLGTEGEGLCRATLDACDHVVRIPMHHGVDSLNVAAASAVAFWQLRAPA